MATFRDQMCSVCFSRDRKLMILKESEEKQNFLQFICGISAHSLVVSVHLCWECAALVRRFNRFKIQARESLTTLNNYSDKYPEVTTSLQITKQFTVNCDPNEQSDGFYSEIIKTEEYNESIIKEEYDINATEDANNSDVYSDDDDKTLVELSTKVKKELSNCRKKRRKKEVNLEDQEIKKETQYYVEKELTSQEIEEERKCLELEDNYVNSVYRCERCILSFPNADDLKDHISIKHDLNATLWKCRWCECSFGSQVAFNYHSSKHTRRYVCVTCGNYAYSKRAARKHFETSHMARAELEYSEINENGTDKDETLEINGAESINYTAAFQCEFCDKSFRWKTSLRKHLETHRIEMGQKRRPYCETCRLSFTTTSNLQKHVKTSSKHQIQLKLRKLKEDISLPGATDKDQAKIEQIRCTVNSKKQLFACSQCDRRFQWRGNLLRHLHSHRAKANGELVCEPCNRSFSSIATYKQHMKISRKHVEEKDFKYMCTECGKKFANKTRLKDHVDWEHLKNYVHKCPVCLKVFKSHTSLYLHKQVVHKKNNPEHLCDHCGKPFPNRAKLRNHIIALHTSEAPYSCPSCNARFSWHSCLSRHVRRVHRANTQPHTALQIQTRPT